MSETTLSLADLQATIASLAARVESLETALAEREAAHTEAPSDDVILAIAAACAAYLGTRAKIKQVHFRRHTTWAKQGRAAVQNSHIVRTR